MDLLRTGSLRDAQKASFGSSSNHFIFIFPFFSPDDLLAEGKSNGTSENYS